MYHYGKKCQILNVSGLKVTDFSLFFFTLGYRHIRLLSDSGEPLENSTLFIHVAITNKKGGGVSRSCIIILCSKHMQIVSSCMVI
jgi:hypothetical protein